MGKKLKTSGEDPDSADLHQLDRVHRAYPNTGPATYTVIRMYLIVSRHVHQHYRSHVAEFGAGATVLADIVVDQGAVSRGRILPVRRLKLLVRVLKMEQHPE